MAYCNSKEEGELSEDDNDDMQSLWTVSKKNGGQALSDVIVIDDDPQEIINFDQTYTRNQLDYGTNKRHVQLTSIIIDKSSSQNVAGNKKKRRSNNSKQVRERKRSRKTFESNGLKKKQGNKTSQYKKSKNYDTHNDVSYFGSNFSNKGKTRNAASGKLGDLLQYHHPQPARNTIGDSTRSSTVARGTDVEIPPLPKSPPPCPPLPPTPPLTADMVDQCILSVTVVFYLVILLLLYIYLIIFVLLEVLAQ